VLKQDRRSAVADAIQAPDRNRAQTTNSIASTVLDFSARTGLDEERGFPAPARLAARLFDLTGTCCARCGGVLDAHSTLKSLRHDDYHCGLCACGYEASVDEQVEVAFTVSPRIAHCRARSEHAVGVEYFRQVFWSRRVSISTGVVRVADRRGDAGYAGTAGGREGGDVAATAAAIIIVSSR